MSEPPWDELAALGYYRGETHYYDPVTPTTMWLRSDGAGSSVPVMSPVIIALLDIIEARASQPLTLDVERVMDAEHRWCVQVDGDYALRHEVEAHRKHAEHIVATLSQP